MTYLSDLGDGNPDFDAVEALADDIDAHGVYAFSFDTLDGDSTLHGRAWVPSAGIKEDPVTGMASGATGAYLEHYGAFGGDIADEMVFEQGHFVDRPGHVRVRVQDGGAPKVGGTAVETLDGELQVPPVETDDILEA